MYNTEQTLVMWYKKHTSGKEYLNIKGCLIILSAISIFVAAYYIGYEVYDLINNFKLFSLSVFESCLLQIKCS